MRDSIYYKMASSRLIASFGLILFLNLLANTTLASDPTASLQKTDVLTWPRSKAPDFGCFLEKTFRHKDKKFNCSLKGYVNKGDPCKNTDAYYDGPKFPESKAKEVHPLIDNIELTWEHGDLQMVSFTLNKTFSEKEVKGLFKLPDKNASPRPNVMSVSVQQCGKKNTCLLLQGFDHMGAGDVDCGG